MWYSDSQFIIYNESIISLPKAFRGTTRKSKFKFQIECIFWRLTFECTYKLYSINEREKNLFTPIINRAKFKHLNYKKKKKK